jgi:acyl-coenzyme A synthetase/AMP-(fatty) acid ligase
VPTPDALRQHGRGRLAAYKLPEAILLTEDLPRTAMEKIDRTALGALVADAPTPAAPRRG